MRYIEISIDTSSAGIEPVVSALAAIGITETVIEDPRDIEDLLDKKEDYEWDYVDPEVTALRDERPRVILYLEDNEEDRKKIEAVKDAVCKLKVSAEAGEFGEGVDFGALTVTAAVNDDAEWKDRWKEYFKPAKISDRIVIKPTWESYEKKGRELVIEIDPGMAFGTGTHETTSMCVRMMEKYMKPGDRILDVGCGSGILSIAGAKLGADQVLGIDIDPVAVQVSEENICRNHVENRVTIRYGDLTKGVDFQADMVVANLMADLLLLLTGDVARHLKSGGIYILSGILLEKEELILQCLREKGFEVEEVAEEGDWCCPVARFVGEK